MARARPPPSAPPSGKPIALARTHRPRSDVFIRPAPWYRPPHRFRSSLARAISCSQPEQGKAEHERNQLGDHGGIDLMRHREPDQPPDTPANGDPAQPASDRPCSDHRQPERQHRDPGRHDEYRLQPVGPFVRDERSLGRRRPRDHSRQVGGGAHVDRERSPRLHRIASKTSRPVSVRDSVASSRTAGAGREVGGCSRSRFATRRRTRLRG